jgi:hypothetical protein
MDSMVRSCRFDLCALEGKGSQDVYRCSVYQSLVQTCYNYASKNNLKWNLATWRDVTGCPSNCGPNQVYGLRTECPKTCLNQDGKYDCGLTNPIESCYCAPGFFANSNSECIDTCGCRSPDRRSILSVIDFV